MILLAEHITEIDQEQFNETDTNGRTFYQDHQL